MYKDNSQLRIEDFVFPYGTLDPENDWVKLAALVPWDTVEQRYAAQFVNNGHPAHPARMAFGALLIKQRLKCSDEWVVKHISENPYLQYFIGMKEYGSSCPFGALNCTPGSGQGNDPKRRLQLAAAVQTFKIFLKTEKLVLFCQINLNKSTTFS